MKPKQTDLAQYELLHGETEYDFEFADAPSTELLIDVFSDKPASLFLHIVRHPIDKWVPVVSSHRHIEFRGRFANCAGARLSCPKDATLNALIIGNPVGIDPIDYTPRTAKLMPEAPSVAELVAREVKKLLPQKPQREIHPDPELMGDEIAEQHSGFEIDDDDPLDPAPGVVLQDEPDGDPGPDPDRTGADPDPRHGDARTAPAARQSPPAAKEPPIPDAVAGGDGS